MAKDYRLTQDSAHPFIFLLALLLLTATFVSSEFGLPFGGGAGGGGGFGFGGDSFMFPAPPLGPVHLPPVNASSRWSDILRDTVQQVLDLCKSVRLCNAAGWYTDLDSDCSDCHPCTCDAACYARGDCCVDKLLEDVGEQLVLGTAPLDDPVVACHSLSLSHSDMAVHVFMQDSCLEGFADREVAGRCHNLTDGTLPGWPVWSPTTDTVYRNTHCATCNEDNDDLMRWNLRVDCDSGVDLGQDPSAVSIMERIHRKPTCRVSFSPPEGSSPVTCRPVIGQYIGTCNMTGQRDTYDQALWKACEVFQGKVTLQDTYKNVFCAMCNQDLLEAMGKCEEGGAFPFYVVLNGTRFQLDPDRDAQAAGPCGCKESEIYDTYEGKCRQLYCSMGSTLIGDQCQSMVLDAKGLSYDIAISLTPLDRQPVQLRAVTSLKRVARNIRTAFMLQGSTASGWDVRTRYLRVIAQTSQSGHTFHTGQNDTESAQNVTSFKVNIRFSSMWSEPADTLESRLFALMTSQWNISVDGKPKRSFTASPLFVRRDTDKDKSVYPEVGKVSPEGRFVEFAIDIPDQETDSFDTPVFETSYHAKLSAALRCSKVSFNLSMKKDSKDVALEVDTDSGDVHHILSGKVVSFQFVEIEDDGTIMVCADQLYDGECDRVSTNPDQPVEAVLSAEMTIVSATFCSVSVVFLLVVVVVHIACRELWTASGRNSLGLATTLLMATGLLDAGVLVVKPGTACAAVGVAAHFFLLSSLAWSAICTSHAYRDLIRSINSSLDGIPNKACICAGYVALSMLVPAGVVAVTVIVHLASGQGQRGVCTAYWGGNGVCMLSEWWSVLLAAVLPAVVALVVTVVLYVLATRAMARLASERQEAYRPSHRRLASFARVSGLLQLTWLVGMVAVLLKVDLLWYLFVVLCCLLAVCVAVTFLATRRVLGLCRARLARCCLRKSKFNADHKFTAVETRTTVSLKQEAG